MRLKQQSFLDKYLEKIVLLVAVLIAVGIFYFYIWGNPYSVELNPGQAKTWQEVEQDVDRMGKQLATAVRRPDAAEELKNIKIPDYAKRFIDRYAQKLVQASSYPMAFHGPGAADFGPVEREKDLKPKIILPPAATEVKVASSYHVLDSDQNILAAMLAVTQAQFPNAPEDAIYKHAQDLTKQIIEKVGRRQPRDFPVATIAATIDPEARKALYKAVPEADGRTPEGWYENLLRFVTSIEIRRQMQDPVTGVWPSDDSYEVIEPLPGSVHYVLRDYVKQVQTMKNAAKPDSTDVDVDMMDMTQALFEVLGHLGRDLVQPAFLPVTPHRPWVDPYQEVLQLSDEDQRKLFDVNKRIKKAESELAALKARAGIKQNGAGSSFNRGFEESYPEGPVRPPRPNVPPRPVTPPKADPNKVDKVQERITILEKNLIDLLNEKDAIINKPDPNDPTRTGEEGFRRQPITPNPRFPEEGFGDRRYPSPRGPQRIGPDGRPILDPDAAEGEYEIPKIQLWAHDATVKPGATYRYRVVYRVINPLFNKEPQLHADLKVRGKELEQASEPSAWSEAITIDPLLQFFVEDVNTTTSVATFGVYRIYNGNRIYKQFQARPGDPIGKIGVTIDAPDTEGVLTQQTVDLQVPAVLVDVKSPPRTPGAINVRGPVSVLIAYLKDGTFEVRDPAADRDNVNRQRMYNEATGGATSSTNNNPGFNPGFAGEGPIPIRPGGSR